MPKLPLKDTSAGILKMSKVLFNSSLSFFLLSLDPLREWTQFNLGLRLSVQVILLL